MRDSLTVALAQIAPVWLDRDSTLAKVLDWTGRAADAGAGLVAFGEALVPGYPWWVEHTGGARFDDAQQKRWFAHYLDQGCEPRHLAPLAELAHDRDIAIVLGCMERATDRGGHSLYCSAVTITPAGGVQAAHRKLMPTHEERLVWAQGDGHGLRTHRVGPFCVGTLNCWENWMPLARAALHAQGEDLHVMLWPGNRRNTEPMTRFVAREGRSYVLSVSGVMRREHVPDDAPDAELLRASLPEVSGDGGSCIAGPDGEWVVAPQTGGEQLITADLDATFVRRERHNFDPSGHYARPEILRVHLDDRRHGNLLRHDRGGDDA